MAEYWKSLPRKFCDICRCWFADNKASIDFHERGKRHQENAQKRIQDIQKRGIKEFKKQKELENEMEKIEKAALAAYERDLRNMQDGNKSESDEQISKYANSASVCNVKPKSLPTVQTAKTNSKCASDSNIKPKHSVNNRKKKQEISVKSTEVHDSEPTTQNVWYEAETEEGYKYYWNAETSESRWEAPDEGFVSIEQSQQNTESATEEQEKSVEETKSTSTEKNKEENTEVVSPIGPQPKADPYGQWITVKNEEPVEYDLQLPTPTENAVEIVIPIHKEESLLKFKEKVIGQLSDVEPGEVTFKKRKFTGSFKRNARQRTTDDD